MTGDDRKLSGVSIGRDNLGAAAGGKGAQAIQNVGNTPVPPRLLEVFTGLEAVRRAIEVEPLMAEIGPLTLRDVDRIESEIKEEDPDKEAIASGFSRLISRAGAAAGVATAIYNVKRLVDDLLA